jgi:hypothetical protein
VGADFSLVGEVQEELCPHGPCPCWNCRVPGHNRAQCTKKWPQADSQVISRERGQARESSGEGHASFASVEHVQALGTPFDKVQAGHVHFVLTHSATQSVDALKRDSWIVDSGATVHIVNDLNLLTDPVIYDIA